MSTPEIEIANITKSFGGVVAVDDVSFSLESGSVTGLIGPNGAGKTTLLNVISGFFRPTAGTIHVRGTDLTGKRPHNMARAGIGRTYQNLLLLDQETVAENIRIGRHRIRRTGGGLRRKDTSGDVDRFIEELGLGDVAHELVAGLPYGLRRRVEIARALATEPSVLVLDEPTAGMTREESDDIGQVVRDLKRGGTTVLLVEHNVRLVTDICDEVIVLNWGRLIGREKPEQVWDLDVVREAYLGRAGRKDKDHA